MVIVGISYGAVAAIVFVLCVILGAKRDVVGQGIFLGFWNSLWVAAFWPIMLLSIIAGWIYDAVVFCKNL